MGLELEPTTVVVRLDEEAAAEGLDVLIRSVDALLSTSDTVLLNFSAFLPPIVLDMIKLAASFAFDPPST